MNSYNYVETYIYRYVYVCMYVCMYTTKSPVFASGVLRLLGFFFKGSFVGFFQGFRVLGF